MVSTSDREAAMNAFHEHHKMLQILMEADVERADRRRPA
jgi:hypothetical protein